MHFEAYPPEVNSANIYAGPGPDSMLAASINCITTGPAQASIRDSSVRLTDLCVQLSEVERQIHEIVRAYEWAHHDMVPLAQIYNNRAERQILIDNNALGQFTAQIADLDQEYDDFWDEDGEVMRDYRLRVSDALSKLTPWKAPPPIAHSTVLVAPVSPSTASSRTDT